MIQSIHTNDTTSTWDELASRVLAGHPLTREEGLAILDAPEEDVLDLVSAAFRLRRAAFGRTVQLYFLVNAKSGICPEDCHYCSQSKISDAEVPKYKILTEDQLMDGARHAAKLGSRTYCMVISGRSPTTQEMRTVTTVVPRIKRELGLHICACLGLLSSEQAQELKACGVDRVNHNLNTSEEHYDDICTTHTYADRMATLEAVKAAGLEMCSGGIVGMGEKPHDLVDMALALQKLQVQSIPINFLNPIDGTPLAGRNDLTPRMCLKVLCLFRFANPRTELRIAGGREIHLRSLQPLGLYVANSIFVGDYLTTKGQAPVADYRMIEDMGFEIIVRDEHGVEHACPPPKETAEPLRVL